MSSGLLSRLFAAAVLLTLLACAGSLEASQRWRFAPITVDGVKDTVVWDFALGADGVPWIALSEPNGTVCYWQEGQWHKIEGDFVTNVHTCQLFKTPIGQVYLSQLGGGQTTGQPKTGQLYRLQDKQAVLVTEFNCGHGSQKPRLFFDSKGRIWNWGRETLAVFDDGQWQRVSANLKDYGTLFEDGEGSVYAFGSQYVSYYRGGRFTLDVELPPAIRQMRTRVGSLWGSDKVLFMSMFDRKIAALDLSTMKMLDILANEPVLSRFGPRSLFRDSDGDVWVYASIGRPGDAEDRRRGQSVVWEYMYAQFHAEDGTVEKKPDLIALGRGNPRRESKPRSVLHSRDGTLYFGACDAGIDIYRNGVFNHLDWRDGLPLAEVDWISENPVDGTIWFVTPRSGMAVHDPRGTDGRQATSRFQDRWTQFDLAAQWILPDFQGRFWCHRADRPESLSCWDGQTWTYVEPSFEPGTVSFWLIDQLGRLHASTTRSSRPAYRIDGQNVTSFLSFRAMLVDSARTGSKMFYSSAPESSPPPVVVDPNRIWWSQGRSNLCLYDGIQWYSLRTRGYARPILWPDDSVVIMSDSKPLILERGQLVDFDNGYSSTDKVLVGENGVQVFDPSVYAAQSDRLFLARRGRHTLFVFQDLASFLASSGDEFPPEAIELLGGVDRVQPVDGGFWFRRSSNRITRCWKGLLMDVDLRRSPFGASGCHKVFEDSKGNLWLRSTDALFRVQQPVVDTMILNEQERVCHDSRCQVEFRGTIDGEVSSDLWYSWRIDDGSWSKPSREEFADVSFKKSGFHEIEVVAFDDMATLDTSPAELIVKAELPISVEIVSAPSKRLTQPYTVIRYRMINNTEEVSAIYQWRLDGRQWHNTTEDFAELTELTSGEHCFEVRVIIDETYTQRVPARVDFEVRASHPRQRNHPVNPVHPVIVRPKSSGKVSR